MAADRPNRSLAGLDAERSGILFIVAVLAVIALAGLAFWLAGSLAGIVVIVAFVALVMAVGFRRDRRTTVEVRRRDDGVHRILVLAHEGLGGEELATALRADAEERRSQAQIVVPALASPLQRLASATDEEAARAERDLERLLEGARRQGIDANGAVGDSDPRLALEDSLKTFPADEIVVVNPPGAEMGSLERSATARAIEDVPLPVRDLHVSAADREAAPSEQQRGER